MARDRLFLLLLTFAFIPLSSVSALDIPPLRGRVNDYAGLMPADRARSLENRLASFEKATGHQIAVLTIPGLQGEDLEGFSIRVAESWKIGKKGFDNGVILLIAKNDRKLRIEVGYGLEGVLPDAIASRIIREVIVPRFRANDYAGGIEAGIEAILKVTRGEPLPESTRTRTQAPSVDPSAVASTIAFIAILVAWIGSRKFFYSPSRSLTQRMLLGGSFGTATAIGAVAFQTASGYPFFVGLLIPMLFICAIAGALASVAEPARSGSGAWSGSSGSDFGRGSSGGFSGGGGGFGGGGASGSW